MHYVTVKGILSSSGHGMNLYHGCLHGCIYCDAHSSCYQMEHLFTDIEIKENALELLEAALKTKRKACMIGTGAMTDPYTPPEKDLLLTRRSLQLLEKYGFGATVHTKSDLVLRDLDILQRINQRTKAVVQMTLTTCDEDLCRLVEPNVCTTARRVAALKEFQTAGIPTVVWLCPILPFLNDTAENIRGIVERCADAGVKGIIQYGMGLTLRDGSREFFYANLDKKFPGLKERYIRTYGAAYNVPSPREKELLPLFHSLCEQHGIWHDNDQIFRYLQTLEDETSGQLSFF